MKLHEFKSNNLQVIEAKSLHKLPITNQAEVELFFEGDSCYLEFQQQIYLIELSISDSTSLSSIRNLITQDSLWFFIEQRGDTVFLSGIRLDAQSLLDDSQDFDIAVDEAITQLLVDDNKISANEIALATEWFRDEFLLPRDDSTSLAFSIFYSNQSERQILLMGRTHQVEINEIQGYWQIDKVSKKRPRGNYRLVALLGNWVFKDHSAAKRVIGHEMVLREHAIQHGDYIETWKQYSDIQWKIAVERANQISYIKYVRYTPASKSGYWYVYIDDSTKLLNFEKKWDQFDKKKGDQVELNVNLPDWLNNQIEVNQTGLKLNNKSWRAEIVKIESDDNRILLKFVEKRDRRPPFDQTSKNGFLFLSIFSVNVQRKRQQNALNLISGRNNPMPSLHSLLQGIDTGFYTRTLRRYKWKSPKTKQLFKGGRPTIKQQEAIELGLNSSDLTIIIGPPGTGKTQVITALQQRISEESEGSIKRSILLTSYQHDAVDNVVDRSKVMGIAGLRVGGKVKEELDEENGVDTIKKWTLPVQKVLQQEIQSNNFIKLYRQLEEYGLQLRLGNIEQKKSAKLEIQEILKRLVQDYELHLPYDLDKWLQDFNVSHSTVSSELRLSFVEIYPLICAVRTTATSYEDDGIQNCQRLLKALEKSKSQDTNVKTLLTEYDVLREFMNLNINEISQVDFLPLINLKNNLIDRFLPDYRPERLQRVLDENVCQKIDQILQIIAEKAKQSQSLAHLMVLDRYHDSLETTTGEIRDAMTHYTAVLAATCQQAAGNAMQDLTALNQVSNGNQKGNIIFENVIVDEAARATPLDLMIPMAMAKRRLILVGDHRQLPHMLDDKVEEELSQQQEWKVVQSQMLQQSLFQRLVEKMRQLEDEKQQPKRVIMLDTQFRMHPILGNFVSKNFYENHNLPPVKSGRPWTDFIHSISNYNHVVCAFKHIESEGQKRLGTSWCREGEAQWIAKEVKRVLDEKPELSIGVISFYSGQVKTILKEMANPQIGLTKEDKIVESYRLIEVGNNIGHERLRIGTVDAFQGKEFDIVFMSIVRTLPNDFQIDRLDDFSKDNKLTKAYGFLRVDNRLNVALSRQRSLLVVVGDKNLVEHPATQEAVPALPAFLALCEGEHGKVF